MSTWQLRRVDSYFITDWPFRLWQSCARKDREIRTAAAITDKFHSFAIYEMLSSSRKKQKYIWSCFMACKVGEKQFAPSNYSHALAGVLNASCGLCWTAAYVLYVRQARRDQSYGMPLGALVLNLSWEFVYTFLWPVHGVGRIFHFPWVFVDVWVTMPLKMLEIDWECVLLTISLLLAETIKNGPRMWQDSSPIVAQNFSIIVTTCVLLALATQWSFAHQFSKSNSSFWSAYLCQNVSQAPYGFLSI